MTKFEWIFQLSHKVRYSNVFQSMLSRALFYGLRERKSGKLWTGAIGGMVHIIMLIKLCVNSTTFITIVAAIFAQNVAYAAYVSTLPSGFNGFKSKNWMTWFHRRANVFFRMLLLIAHGAKVWKQTATETESVPLTARRWIVWSSAKSSSN